MAPNTLEAAYAATPASPEAEAGDASAHPSSHIKRLPDPSWGVWQWVSVRGAGFPASGVLELGFAECAAAADELADAEEGAELTNRKAVEVLRAALPNTEATGRRPLSKAIHRLKKGSVPELSDAEGEVAEAVERFAAAVERRRQTGEAYRRAYEVAAEQSSRLLRETAASEPFRQAVLWQNRGALHRGVNYLLSDSHVGGRESARRRSSELMVASYLQRYCVKNDTIGFFGPVGWANLKDEGPRLRLRPGPSLVAARRVYFEGWALDKLASTFCGDERLRPWLRPRRVPFIDFDERTATLYVPLEPPRAIPQPLAWLLAACDGRRTVKEMAAGLIGAGALRAEGQVYELLGLLERRGLITWSLEVPWVVDAPREWHIEAHLRNLIEGIGDDAARSPFEEGLRRLEHAKRGVAEASGAGAERLDAALEELEQTFTELTGAEAGRAAGKTYAGRGLVYEDCRRDLEAEIGPDLLAEIGQPLGLLLESARWFTAEAARLYRERFHALYRELAPRGGGVEAVHFWRRARAALYDDSSRVGLEVARGLQQRWERVLGPLGAERHVSYGVEELESRVREAFGGVEACALGRYHSPDLMIAAAGEEELRRGEYLAVMGELHMGINTLGNQLFLGQHPTPAHLFRALEADNPEPRLIPLTPKNMLTSRVYPIFATGRDYRLEMAADTPGLPGARVVPIGALLIDEQDGRLVARTRDSRLRFEIIEAFADVLALAIVNDFKPLPSGSRRAPRVTIGRLVVARETWRFAAAEMAFASESDEAVRFARARQWARAQGLPRQVFVRVPTEVKPFYVDFASPVFVNLLAKVARGVPGRADVEADAGAQGPWDVTMTEMLPDTGQAWLSDAEGRRYTSELRFAVVDLAR
jgi:hypothetical protein